MSMDIYTKPGALVKYANPHAGYACDQETAAKYLVYGSNYTVAYTDVHNWHTDVFIEGFDGIRFNSVMFEDAE